MEGNMRQIILVSALAALIGACAEPTLSERLEAWRAANPGEHIKSRDGKIMPCGPTDLYAQRLGYKGTGC
jgi:hypothetical protein